MSWWKTQHANNIALTQKEQDRPWKMCWKEMAVRLEHKQNIEICIRRCLAELIQSHSIINKLNVSIKYFTFRIMISLKCSLVYCIHCSFESQRFSSYGLEAATPNNAGMCAAILVVKWQRELITSYKVNYKTLSVDITFKFITSTYQLESITKM